MIGGHDLDVASRQRRPERLHLAARPQRRRAFRQRAQRLRILFVEEQVVRTGLGRDVNAALTCLSDQGQTATGADVDDVECATGRLGEEQRATDGLDLGDNRPRRQVVAHPGPTVGRSLAPPARRSALSFSAWTATGRPSARRALHSLQQRGVVGGAKVVDPRVRHKGLEADHASRQPTPPCDRDCPE